MCGTGMISDYTDESLKDFLYDGDQMMSKMDTRGRASHGHSTFVRDRNAEFTGFQNFAGRPSPGDIVSLAGKIKEQVPTDRPAISCIIAHTRWAVSGDLDTQNGQPNLRSTSRLASALAFNGQDPGYRELSKRILGVMPDVSETDTPTLHSVWRHKYLELAADSTVRTIQQRVEETVAFFMGEVGGAYSVVMQARDKKTGHELQFGFRSPEANRPLAIGRSPSGRLVCASESALFPAGYEFGGEVKPGELVVASKDGWIRKIIQEGGRDALCAMDLNYLMRPSSLIEDRNGKIITVGDSRRKMGMQAGILFQTQYPKAKIDIVMPVYEGGYHAALGVAESFGGGVPIAENGELVVKHDVGQTYPAETVEETEILLKRKFKKPLDRSRVKDKTILIVDDSVVKGSTIKRIVKILHKMGAKAVYICIPTPPLVRKDDRGMVIKKLIFRDGKRVKTLEEVFAELELEGGVFGDIDRMIQSSGKEYLHTGMFEEGDDPEF